MSSIHALYGVGQPLYSSLVQINSLASRRATRFESDEANQDFLETASAIEVELQKWNPRESSDEPSREAMSAAVAFQWAALMRLHQVVHGYAIPHPKVETATRNMMTAFSSIRHGSKIEARILFPLVMAGVGATNVADRMTVRYRLLVMERTIGFGNIFRAHKLVETVWERMDAGEKDVNWARIMYTEFPGIVLF